MGVNIFSRLVGITSLAFYKGGGKDYKFCVLSLSLERGWGEGFAFDK